MTRSNSFKCSPILLRVQGDCTLKHSCIPILNTPFSILNSLSTVNCQLSTISEGRAVCFLFSPMPARGAILQLIYGCR
jgi:hypothetical protein